MFQFFVVEYMYTIGYCKDAMATILFLLYFVIFCYLVEDINAYKPLILMGLVLGFCIDGTFSLLPKYHHTLIGKNIPTLIVFGAAIFHIGFCFYFFKLHRF